MPFILFTVLYFDFLDLVEPSAVQIDVWMVDAFLFLAIDYQLNLGRDQIGGIQVLGDVWAMCGDFDLGDLLISRVVHH